MLLRIVSTYFVAGVVIGERTAPIVNYMRVWGLAKIQLYCLKKGWECQILSQ